MTLQEVLSLFDGVKRTGDGQYMARCPCHDDRKQSLSMGLGNNGSVVMKCQAGCQTMDILARMGLSMNDLYPETVKLAEKPRIVATYDYKADVGKGPLLAQKLRKSDKSFSWRKPDGKGGWTWNRKDVPHVLYAAGEDDGNVVCICEGEKDCDNLAKLGYFCVSGADGAGHGKWHKEYTRQLQGRSVLILPDNDQIGREYAEEIARALYCVTKSCKVLDLSKVWHEIPEKGDISDMIAALGQGKTAELLAQLEIETAEWTPTAPAQKEAEYRAAKSAADFKDADTKFLWYPYLPIGDYSVMMADGGTGKTILCCGIASVLSNGALFPGEVFSRTPQDTLIISAEDTGEVLKGRLKKSGADLTRVKIIDCRDSVGMSISEGYEEFRATIQKCAPALVIVDPWHAFLGEKVDISRVNAVRPLLQKLANIAKECSCAMILVSHVNKRAQGENANNAATGSTDFINAARSAFRVIFDGADDDCRIMVHTKTNYAPYGQSIKYRIDDGGVVWVGFSEITRSTLEAAARKHSTPHETLMGVERKAEVNAGLIAALKASAGLMAPARFSYEEFKEKHGDLIFGAQQPKRALDRVKKLLEEDGYYIKTGIQVPRNKQQKNGFLIQQIGDMEYEQVATLINPTT